MTDDLCGREGCGAPRAWHVPDTTIREIRDFSSPLHEYADIHVVAGSCMGGDCHCPGYLAPEPPKPERKPYVVELKPWPGGDGPTGMMSLEDGRRIPVVPLDEYLAAHPQPAPALCICGGTADEHDPVTGRCQHKAHRMLYSDSGSVIERLRCGCQKFAAQP